MTVWVYLDVQEVFPSVSGSVGVLANVTLTVPAGKAAAYKASPDWSGFKEYIEDGVEPDPYHVVVDGIHYELTDKLFNLYS